MQHTPTPALAPRTSFVTSGGAHPCRLFVQQWGNPKQPTVVLVHGYPDNSEVWARVVPLLAADFHVVTYDVRGAGQSDRPEAKVAYQLPQLCLDFQAVINAVSPERPVHVVAHDWGSVQSWESVTEPGLKGRIASFTSCSGPCLDHMGHWFRDQISPFSLAGLGAVTLQGLKSWYIYFFHLPVLPRLQWRWGLGRAWPTVMRWLEGLHIEGHPQQGLDGSYGILLYRANIFQRMFNPRQRVAHAPVHILVPTKDLYVGPALTRNLGRWVPQLTRTEFPAGHWMPLSHPQDFAQAVRQFVQQHETPETHTQAA